MLNPAHFGMMRNPQDDGEQSCPFYLPFSSELGRHLMYLRSASCHGAKSEIPSRSSRVLSMREFFGRRAGRSNSALEMGET